MTFVAPESAPGNAARIPSIVVLGADALLAALPATPVQLAHACALAGYQGVVPASWGDELIATATLRALSDRGSLPAIQCSCPHVAHRLLAVGTDLRPFLLSLVAPPVVLARYLRAAHAPARLRITYVGKCPGAADESIDARLTPEELLAMFVDRRIVLEEQPTVFDSVIPPDRRRYRSQPGGLPTPEMLWTTTSGASGGARALVELYGEDMPVELAQQLLAGKPVLIDCAPKLGCVCSGAGPAAAPSEARARVVALEPPRASHPVIDEQLLIDAALPLPASPRSAIDIVAPPSPLAALAHVEPTPDERARMPRREEIGTHLPTFAAGESSPPVPPLAPRHPSPARGIARPAASTLPTARDAGGRQLPRTYVAHRRAPSRTPRGGVSTIGVARRAATPPPGAAALPNAERPSTDAPERSAETEIDGTSARAVPLAPAEAITAEPILAAREPATVAKPVATAPGEAAAPVEPQRYAERTVTLPITPRSDVATPASSSYPAGERPLMQLLTLGLLISMIVLVSAAVGVLVGRWMTQR